VTDPGVGIIRSWEKHGQSGIHRPVIGGQRCGRGGHLFWRDWDRGLAGLTGGFIHGDLVDSGAGGVEGEYYLDRLTFLAGLGAAHIGYDTPVPFIDTSVTDFYAAAGLRYYLLDDLMFGATCLHLFDNELGVGQIEYQTPILGLGLFAEVAMGDTGRTIRRASSARFWTASASMVLNTTRKAARTPRRKALSTPAATEPYSI
jgi:hypothetical protein